MGVENFLVRTKFSNFLIEDIKKEIPSEEETIDLLSIEILDNESITKVRKKIKEIKDKISSANLVVLNEELSEIKEDLKWVKSKRGQYVIEINNWYKSFRDEFRSIKEYEDIMIGGHSKIMCVFITGKINKELVDQLTKYIVEKRPPYKLKFELF